MKFHLTNYKKYLRIIVALVILLIVTVLSSGCKKESKSNLIICNLDDYSLYPKFIEQILPSYSINQTEDSVYRMIKNGAIVEAFDTQAVGVLQAGVAEYWYPHYLATVIIAIDRDQSETVVNSWTDLLDSQEQVAFSNSPVNNQMLAAAISFGLEGEDYTLKQTLNLLESLHKNSLLNIDSFDSPLIICFDYQAGSLIESGRNIEIIIPTEGTLTYEKGLLSNEELIFEDDLDKLLLESKFRLLDGQGDSTIYPDNEAYRPAVKVTDYDHLAKVTSKVGPLIERRVLKSKRFMTIDYGEHLYVALIYMSIVTLWVASVLRRSMQKGISYAAFFAGIILNGWALVRLIKYQIIISDSLSRYLWYSYYIFQLSLPLVILWMAWAVDKPEKETFPPKWWRILSIFIGLLIILVFTNDLHGLVFQLDLNRPDWGINYSYSFGYYIILFVCMMNIAIAFLILLMKSLNSPRKKGFILPLGVFILFGVYNYKYIIRDPFIYETDLTIVTGVFAMLMFEACIRSGLIPVNSRYIDIFKRSPLRIQILNKNRELAMASAMAIPINKDTIEKVIASSPCPILQEDRSLLFANEIPGGYALWSEDVSKIHQVYREIQQSTEKLRGANIILAEEEKIKRAVNEKNAKKQLMEQLEDEIAENIEKLSSMIENLEGSENRLMETTGVALLLCYIKRRCNLFFKEKEMHKTEADELIMYMDELCEIAKYSNVQIVIANGLQGRLPIRYATLFYDFYYTIVDLAVQKGCPYIIVNIGTEEDSIIMRLLPSMDIGEFKIESKLIEAIATAKGKTTIKDIDDTIGISISFPKGEDKYD